MNFKNAFRIAFSSILPGELISRIASNKLEWEQYLEFTRKKIDELEWEGE